jgi:Pentapeptide repeats (9 copies)
VIDLRPDNSEFADQFYQLLQARLQQPGAPLGLDLSEAQIQGDLAINRLGLRVPIYGEAFSPLFSEAERAQLQRDRRRLARLNNLSQSLLLPPPTATGQTPSAQITVWRGPLKLVGAQVLGQSDLSNVFFLKPVAAQGARFGQGLDGTQTRFGDRVSFANASFGQVSRWRSSIFFGPAAFNQAQFGGLANFQGSEFQGGVTFNQASFAQMANFSRTQWTGNADLGQTRWQDQALFTKAKFSQGLFLTDATFEKAVLFREAQFGRPVNLRGASILDRADFGYSSFLKGAYLNVPGLKFDSDRAKIVGDPGQIGQYISVPTRSGNENLIRELIRNFRRADQLGDANQIDYMGQRLWGRELGRQVLGTNLNTASVERLVGLGFSATQAEAILKRRAASPLRSLTELLTAGEIDLATYANVRDRVVAAEPFDLPNRLFLGLTWVGLNLVLLLSRDGTSFWLIFGVGLVTAAYFAVLFWLVDRARRRLPRPIWPSWPECAGVMGLANLLNLVGLVAIFQNADRPWLTLACLGMVTLPLPIGLLALLYRQGRFHPQMETSYFVEEGTLRQLRILIGRLPIIPSFPQFRERYLPIPWDQRWNGLNYFDFSFNNFLRLGFNDIRLRDQHVPTLLTILVWYQWALGTFYIALLLWTLSRTIPGLNLLIYFR